MVAREVRVKKNHDGQREGEEDCCAEGEIKEASS